MPPKKNWAYRLRKTAGPGVAPDFSPGKRVFKPAYTLGNKIRALALVGTSEAVCDFFRSLFRPCGTLFYPGNDFSQPLWSRVGHRPCAAPRSMRVRALPNKGDTARLLLISFHRFTKPVGGFPLQNSTHPILGVFDRGSRVPIARFIRDLLTFSSREVPIERLDFVGLVFVLGIRR